MAFRTAAPPLCGLALVILLLFGSPLLLGLSWLPMPPASFHVSDGHVRSPNYPVGVDNFTFPQFDWPARVVAKEAHDAGELPGWNPYAGLGIPLVGQYETQLLFPLEVFERFVGVGGWQIAVLLRVLLAALGAYLFLGKVGIRPSARLGGALFYGLSAYFIWFLTIPAFASGAMLVPWLFLAAEGLTSPGRAGLRAAALTGLVLGLMLLTGQPQITALAGLACAIFVLVVHVVRPPLSARRFLQLVLFSAIAITVALAISSPQTLYFLEASRWGYSLHAPGTYGGGGTSLLNFTVSLWPSLLGQPMNPWYPGLYPSRVNWEDFPMLLGASGLFLGILGSVMLTGKTEADPARRAIGISMLLILALGFIVPISAELGFPIWHMKGLDRINFSRYVTPVLSLAVATLITFALDNLESARGRALIASVLVSIGVTAVCYAMVHPIIWHWEELPTTQFRYFSESLILGFLPFVVVATSLFLTFRSPVRHKNPGQIAIVIVLIMLGELSYFVRYGFDTRHELLRVFVLVGMCLASLLFLRFKRPAIFLLAILCLSPLLLLATAKRSLPDQFDPAANPSAIVLALQRELGPGSSRGRFVSSENTLTPNFGNVYQLAQLESLAPMQLRGTADVIFGALVDKPVQYALPNAWYGMTGAPSHPSWNDYLARRPFYNVLAVRALVDTKDGWLSKRRIEGIVPVWQDETFVVYRDEQARARAYLVAAPAPDTAMGPELAELRRMDVAKDLAALARNHPLVEGEVEVLRITPGTMEIAIRPSKPALLVVADGYYPSWRVDVDGTDRRVARVAGALRGVFVGPEDRMVKFHFRPWYLSALLWTSALALALVFIIVALCSGRHARILPRSDSRAQSIR
jgi:hypothetical protein